MYQEAARPCRWITESFPNAEHRFSNGGVDAITSSYMSVCLGQHVPPDVDLVMVCSPRHMLWC